jgi:hypothetical protein
VNRPSTSATELGQTAAKDDFRPPALARFPAPKWRRIEAISACGIRDGASAKPRRLRTRNRDGCEREPPGVTPRLLVPQLRLGVWSAAWAVLSARHANRRSEHHAKRSAWPGTCGIGPCSNWRTTNNRSTPRCSDWLLAHQYHQSDQAISPSERERPIVATTNPSAQPSMGTTCAVSDCC